MAIENMVVPRFSISFLRTPLVERLESHDIIDACENEFFDAASYAVVCETGNVK
jgi:hypothetical protein